MKSKTLPPDSVRRAGIWFVGLAVAATMLGCRSHPGTHSQYQKQRGDSIVLIGTEPAFLANLPTSTSRIEVRSTYLPRLSNTVAYTEGLDYSIDREHGAVRRLPGSRIPDFSTNVLYGKAQFDHTKFPGYGNKPFFAYVDYSFTPLSTWPMQHKQLQFLPRTVEKLQSGAELKIVAFGDSITAGGEASEPHLIYWQRWADDLQRKHPGARVTAVNGATGGDTTVQGLQRLKEKVLNEKPDLVLIAFGMNDHNIGSVPIPQFKKNLAEMIAQIRRETAAEVVLLSTFPPNPKWQYGSHRMQNYEVATAKVAASNACAYADVYDNWVAIGRRKKPEDLLANNINHPNDFGHWIYFRVLQGLGL
jgi:lysophospholipase L1-like esterase